MILYRYHGKRKTETIPLDNRDILFGDILGQIGTKLDKSGTFKNQVNLD